MAASALRVPSPREEAQAEVDRGRVQSVNGLVEFVTQIFRGIIGGRALSQSNAVIDAPVPRLIGFGEGVPRATAPGNPRWYQRLGTAFKHTSISRKLSRWVSCAKTRQIN